MKKLSLETKFSRLGSVVKENGSQRNNGAIRAKQALSGVPTSDPARDTEAALVDLLVDLRHLCDSLGLGFAECDRVAHALYVEELK